MNTNQFALKSVFCFLALATGVHLALPIQARAQEEPAKAKKHAKKKKKQSVSVSFDGASASAPLKDPAPEAEWHGSVKQETVATRGKAMKSNADLIENEKFEDGADIEKINRTPIAAPIAPRHHVDMKPAAKPVAFATPSPRPVAAHVAAAPKRDTVTYDDVSGFDVPRPEDKVDESVLNDSYLPKRRLGNTRPFTLIAMAGMGYAQADLYTNNANQALSVQGRADYTAGVLVEYNNNAFGLQTGLVYMRETSQVTEDYTALNTNLPEHDVRDFGVNYLAVPFLGKLSTGAPGETRFSVRAGLAPAMAMSSDSQTSARTTPDGFTFTTVTNAESGTVGVRQFNVFAQAGAGMVVPIDRQFDVRFDVLYSRSLMSAWDDASPTTYLQSVTGVIGIGLGL